MPTDRLETILRERLAALDAAGTAKRHERVVTAVVPPTAGRGPRHLLAGVPGRAFLRCNANGYLGMATRPEVLAAAEEATRLYGVGPQAVRFISGTTDAHVSLERRLARFHGRDAAIVFSSAYAAMVGLVPALTAPDTAIVSDELNHNCIINAIRLAQPTCRSVYRHADVADLVARLDEAPHHCTRALVITDGVFSMRGDHAPLAEITAAVAEHDHQWPDNALTIVDDSHGVGALGATGRGTEEITGARADVLVATLGKAFGANGGYVCGPQALVDTLRETAATYVFSNPIAAADAAAAEAAIDVLDSPVGLALLDHLRARTRRFADGLVALGYETIPGDHPVVPLLTRDGERNRALVAHLFQHGVLATALGHPVVPRGEEEIRFQISAEHTDDDVDEVLAVLRSFRDQRG